MLINRKTSFTLFLKKTIAINSTQQSKYGILIDELTFRLDNNVKKF